jgi:hypothetical protein
MTLQRAEFSYKMDERMIATFCEDVIDMNEGAVIQFAL